METLKLLLFSLLLYLKELLYFKEAQWQKREEICPAEHLCQQLDMLIKAAVDSKGEAGETTGMFKGRAAAQKEQVREIYKPSRRTWTDAKFHPQEERPLSSYGLGVERLESRSMKKTLEYYWQQCALKARAASGILS